MRLTEVHTKAEMRSFLDMVNGIYADDPNYVRPLDVEIATTFSSKNKHAHEYNYKLWILAHEGKIIGRIAAFHYDEYKNYGTDFPTGCFGFFECIHDQTAANLLLQTAADWLKSCGMDAMDGPVNFGDRDKSWGLMVEGFDSMPYYGMSYNPPYYRQLLENFGLRTYYNQYYFHLKINAQVPEKYMRVYHRYAGNPDFKAEHFQKNKLEKYAKDFCQIYNAAWAQHQENKQLTLPQVLAMFHEMRPIIDSELLWFAYYKDDPIAIWINIPDLNAYFHHFNGRFGWWQKLQFLWMKYTGRCKRFAGIVFGVIPRFQRLGIDAYIVCAGAQVIQHAHKFQDYEMGWTSEWNPRMLSMYQNLGSRRSRHMITYRYIWEEKHTFEMHPEIKF